MHRNRRLGMDPLMIILVAAGAISTLVYVGTPIPRAAAGPRLGSALAQTAAPVDARREGGALVASRGGTLSVRVEDVALGPLLERIAAVAGVIIVHGDEVAGDPISIVFEELPLDEGLQRILVGHDAFYHYRGGDLESVWVYPTRTQSIRSSPGPLGPAERAVFDL